MSKYDYMILPGTTKKLSEMKLYELKEYAKKSKGDIQIDLPGYGLVYLKIDKDIQTGNLSYKETAFINSTDGFPITRKAFDAAWDS